MSTGWAGPVWGEPSTATRARVPLRPLVTGADAAYRADGGSTDRFVVMGASAVGVAHRLAGRTCEDAFGWALISRDVLFLAVADGVSGAEHGGRAAQLAVGAACHHVLGAARAAEAMTLCLGAVMDANAVLHSAAEEMSLAPAQLSTTLIVAIVAAEGDGARVDMAGVGDSAAFVLRDGLWEEVGAESSGAGGPEGPDERPRGDVDPGDILSSGTDALPSAAAEEVEDVAVGSFALLPGQALVLMTDGVANAIRDGPTTVAPALATVLAGAPTGDLSPLGLAVAADFSRRGCQDDRTIVVAWPRPQL